VPFAADDGSGSGVASAGESNWVQTIDGRHWFSYFRLDGPLEPYFDRTWKLGDSSLIED